MDIKIRIKNVISNYNIFAIRRRNQMRKNLKNKDFSLICPNCLGGMLLHDLGMPFLSPTVNLMMNQPDFFKFVLRMDYYLAQELNFYNDPNFLCPCAKLGERDKVITIHFTHYENEKDAESYWNKRILRIHRDNLFVVAIEKDGISKDDIIELNKLNIRGLVVFTAHNYPDIPYTCYLPKYQDKGEVGNILARSYLTDKKEYERYFDFVRWFNEACGDDYNCKPFCF